MRSLERLRLALLVLAGLRYVIPLAALPLAARLIPDDVGLLTLLRPGKEVVLLAGGLTRTDGAPGVAITFLAFLPLMVLGVWVFFALGRAYADDLAMGTGPAWLHRMVPDERFEVARRVLVRRGPNVAFLARIAALPPTLVAAAAGASGVGSGRFLVADGVGALASFAIIFGLGLALGEAYESGGPWITGAGLVVLLFAVSLVSSWLRREAERLDGGA